VLTANILACIPPAIVGSLLEELFEEELLLVKSETPELELREAWTRAKGDPLPLLLRLLDLLSKLSRKGRCRKVSDKKSMLDWPGCCPASSELFVPTGTG
jgi:hypothetical protein